MRLMTYNILKGGDEPRAGNRRDAIVALIAEAAPDVLVLNECNGFAPEDGDQLSSWTGALQMHGWLAPAESGYHVALLTRAAPVEDFQVVRDGFAHAACCARVRWGSRRLTVLGCHLDPFDANLRAREAEALLRLGDPRRNLIVMGDLNALSPRDAADCPVAQWSERYRARHTGEGGFPDTRAVDRLEAAGLVDLVARSASRSPTRPTAMYWKDDVPTQRIDYIFTSPDLAATLQAARTLDQPATQAASDHLPVIADLDLARSGSAGIA